MHRTIVPPTHTDDTTPNQPQEQVQAADYIHNFSNLTWYTDDEPAPSHASKLYNLLTITGLTLIAPYPADHTLGEHYLAWAELTSEATLTIH